MAPQIIESMTPISNKITLLFTFFEMAKINSVIKKLPSIAEAIMTVLPIKKTLKI